MTQIANLLFKENICESVNPIYTASIPVLKVIVDPMKIIENKYKEQFIKFKSSRMYYDYPFDKEELDKIKIDFTLMINHGKSIPLLQVEYIKSSLVIYPEIKPIIRLLKRILSICKMNTSFKGGLASFSLFLLLLSYIKIHRRNINSQVVNYGKLLIEFLLHYGTFCDFKFTVIDPNLDK